MKNLIEHLSRDSAVMLVIPIVVGLLVLRGVLQILLSLIRKSGGDGKVTGFPYQKREFLSPAERSFLGALELAIGSRCRVFAKVRLADLIKPLSKLSRGQNQSAFNRISSKHADFVLCDPATLEVLAVVELDDSSHNSSEQQKRDEWKDSALATAAIKVIRIPAARSYAAEELRRSFDGLLPPAKPPALPAVPR